MENRIAWFVIGTLGAFALVVLVLWLMAPLIALQNQPPSEFNLTFMISVPLDDSNQVVRFGSTDVEGMKLRQAEWPLSPSDPYDSAMIGTGITVRDGGERPFEYCFEDPVSLHRAEVDELELFEPGDCVNSDDFSYYPLGRVPE